IAAVTRAWISRLGSSPRSCVSRVTTGLPATSGGPSHSRGTPASPGGGPGGARDRGGGGEQGNDSHGSGAARRRRHSGGFKASTSDRAAPLSTYHRAAIGVQRARSVGRTPPPAT